MHATCSTYLVFTIIVFLDIIRRPISYLKTRRRKMSKNVNNFINIPSSQNCICYLFIRY
jgi:hypothetical protein